MEARNFVAAYRTGAVDELLPRDASLSRQRRVDETRFVFGLFQILVFGGILNNRVLCNSSVQDVVMVVWTVENVRNMPPLKLLQSHKTNSNSNKYGNNYN